MWCRFSLTFFGETFSICWERILYQLLIKHKIWGSRNFLIYWKLRPAPPPPVLPYSGVFKHGCKVKFCHHLPSILRIALHITNNGFLFKPWSESVGRKHFISVPLGDDFKLLPYLSMSDKYVGEYHTKPITQHEYITFSLTPWTRLQWVLLGILPKSSQTLNSRVGRSLILESEKSACNMACLYIYCDVPGSPCLSKNKANVLLWPWIKFTHRVIQNPYYRQVFFFSQNKAPFDSEITYSTKREFCVVLFSQIWSDLS